jgi:hypothetical protein
LFFVLLSSVYGGDRSLTGQLITLAIDGSAEISGVDLFTIVLALLEENPINFLTGCFSAL